MSVPRKVQWERKWGGLGMKPVLWGWRGRAADFGGSASCCFMASLLSVLQDLRGEICALWFSYSILMSVVFRDWCCLCFEADFREFSVLLFFTGKNLSFLKLLACVERPEEFGYWYLHYFEEDFFLRLFFSWLYKPVLGWNTDLGTDRHTVLAWVIYYRGGKKKTQIFGGKGGHGVRRKVME